MCNQNLFRAPLQNPKVLKSWKKLDSTIYLAFTFYQKSQFSNNCEIRINLRNVEVWSIRPILQGEELFMSYGDTFF